MIFKFNTKEWFTFQPIEFSKIDVSTDNINDSTDGNESSSSHSSSNKTERKKRNKKKYEQNSQRIESLQSCAKHQQKINCDDQTSSHSNKPIEVALVVAAEAVERLPPSTKMIGVKWIYKIKRSTKTVRYKA